MTDSTRGNEEGKVVPEVEPECNDKDSGKDNQIALETDLECSDEKVKWR